MAAALLMVLRKTLVVVRPDSKDARKRRKRRGKKGKK